MQQQENQNETRVFRSALTTAFAFVLTFASSAAVQAATPEGIAVAHRLNTSSDPAATWASLTPAQQQAYVEAATVTQMEVVKHPPVEVAAAQTGMSSLTTTCWNWPWEVDGRDAFGIVVFAYFQTLGWCDNGSTITSITAHLRRGETYFLGWSWDQSAFPDWPTWGGVGSSTWRSFTQSEFKFCITEFGCIQYRYPWLDMTAHAGGTGTGSVGGAN